MSNLYSALDSHSTLEYLSANSQQTLSRLSANMTGHLGMFVLAIVLNTIANCLFHFIWNKEVFMVCGWVGQHKHLAPYSLMTGH